MPERVSDPNKPQGWLKLLFRLPVWLYRWHLGWLMGSRFLLLHHTGRKTGRKHKTVLEVVRHDRAARVYYVASGFGERSDWLLNLAREPRTHIQVGNFKLPVRAVRLSKERAADELEDYQRRHPNAFRALARLMGFRIAGSAEDARALAAYLPVIALEPTKPAL